MALTAGTRKKIPARQEGRSTRSRREPGDDRSIGDGSDITVLKAIREYYREAEDAKRTRMLKNRKNMRAYFGEHDWSHKQRGQSREVLPKVPMAVEQISAFFKRGLVDFGQWFAVDLPVTAPLLPKAIVDYMTAKLDTMNRVEPGRLDFATLLGDGIKTGLLQSLMVFKVHGRHIKQPRYQVERGLQMVDVPYGDGTFPVPQRTSTLKRGEIAPWQLLIDLVRPEDYYPDPTGRGLYEIQETERDLSDVVALSEGPDPIYDPKAVALIQEDCKREDEDFRAAYERNQDEAEPPSFRKRVVIREFWGNLLDIDGRVVHENCVAAVANDKYVIRPPEPNPFWHGQSPFVAVPLMRVPGSVWHKAVFDHAVQLNTAMNELFSMMLDGGMASVWGTRQLRAGMLEDPKQVANGIPQGITLVVKDELPTGSKVLETVTTGQVPPDAINMFNTTDREFQSASLVNDIALGQLPSRQVKATEVVEASNNAAVMFDGMVRDVENGGIELILWKGWLNCLQHADDLDSEEVIAAIGIRAAFTLARMPPAERFAAFAGAKFRVSGLSALTARARDFQKKIALMQVAMGNPILLQAFVKRFSGDKMLNGLMRDLNLNPSTMELTDEEQMVPMGQRMNDLAAITQNVTGPPTGGGGGSVKQEESGGDTGLPAEINQTVNPLTGLTANA